MEFSLGKLRLKALGLPLFENHLELIRKKPFKDRAPVKTIFRWDCTTQKGRPSQPLNPVVAHCYLVFHILNAKGRPDVKAEGEMLDRFVVASGLRTRKAFSRAFDEKLPSIPFPVDEAKLIEPFKRNYKFHVTAFPVHNNFVVRANGGRPGDFAFLSIPWYVYLGTRFDGACNDAEPPGLSGMLANTGGEPALNELQKSLNKQHGTDLKEAIRRHDQD